MNDLELFSGDKLDGLYKACSTLSKSALIPYSLRGKDADIFAILVMGQELGIKPMQALQSIDVIQGKPTIKPQLMIGLIKGKLPDAIIKIEKDEIKQVVKCTTARNMSEFKEGIFNVSTWDMNKAHAMGLSNKDNYKKQAMVMFKWRAVAESCRETFADIIMGLYIDSEFKNIDGSDIPEKKELVTTDGVVLGALEAPELSEVQTTCGDGYLVLNGKFVHRTLGEISIDDIEEYHEFLTKKIATGKAPHWHPELLSVLSEYLEKHHSVEVESE